MNSSFKKVIIHVGGSPDIHVYPKDGIDHESIEMHIFKYLAQEIPLTRAKINEILKFLAELDFFNNQNQQYFYDGVEITLDWVTQTDCYLKSLTLSMKKSKPKAVEELTKGFKELEKQGKTKPVTKQEFEQNLKQASSPTPKK